MIIIGELINGTRKAVGAAVEAKDANLIQDLARKQDEAGASFIDCNAGTPGDREFGDMEWVVKTVQEVTDKPLAIDSPNPKVVELGLETYTGSATPMINSVSLEADRIQNMLPLAAERKTNVVALAMDDNGVPSLPGQREDIAKMLIDACIEAGLPAGNIYVDPVVTTQSSDANTGPMILQAIAAIKSHNPEVHVTGGLSNISYGLPNRKLLNRAFVTLAMAQGLDSGIIDPCDEQLIATITAAEALLGIDDWCMNYITASRAGKLGE